MGEAAALHRSPSVGAVDHADALARIRLIRTPSIGPVSFRQLIARFGTAAAAIEALPSLARRGGGRVPEVTDASAARREMDAVAGAGARHLFLGHDDYPALLTELSDAPPVLTIRGNLSLAARDTVAMVGARNASAASCRFARGLAQEVAQAGAAVVSGLARGIDTAAHEGAGTATIGVIAGGIDVAYPPENARLQERIAEEALLVAEMPLGTEPRARHFPHRNRIIAALSLGTVVIEAAPRSGSLITARLAGEAGREVMAVPGHPSDPRAQGCNGLIRDGAVLVQSADDVLEQIRPIDLRATSSPNGVRSPATGWGAPPPEDATEAERRRVFSLLGPVPVGVDELVRQAALAPAVVQMVLLELELGGRLERHAAGRISLC